MDSQFSNRMDLDDDDPVTDAGFTSSQDAASAETSPWIRSYVELKSQRDEPEHAMTDCGPAQHEREVDLVMRRGYLQHLENEEERMHEEQYQEAMRAPSHQIHGSVPANNVLNTTNHGTQGPPPTDAQQQRPILVVNRVKGSAGHQPARTRPVEDRVDRIGGLAETLSRAEQHQQKFAARVASFFRPIDSQTADRPGISQMSPSGAQEKMQSKPPQTAAAPTHLQGTQTVLASLSQAMQSTAGRQPDYADPFRPFTGHGGDERFWGILPEEQDRHVKPERIERQLVPAVDADEPPTTSPVKTPTRPNSPTLSDIIGSQTPSLHSSDHSSDTDYLPRSLRLRLHRRHRRRARNRRQRD